MEEERTHEMEVGSEAHAEEDAQDQTEESIG